MKLVGGLDKKFQWRGEWAPDQSMLKSKQKERD